MTLLTQDIELQLICIAQAAGLGPSKVIYLTFTEIKHYISFTTILITDINKSLQPVTRGRQQSNIISIHYTVNKQSANM